MSAGCNCGPNSLLVQALGCHCVRRGILQSLPVSWHFRGCKVPLFRIVSGAISSELALSEESDLVIYRSCRNWKYADRQVTATWSAIVNLLSIVTPRSRAVLTTLTADDNTGTCRMSTRSIWNLDPSHSTRVLVGFSRSRLAVIQSSTSARQRMNPSIRMRWCGDVMFILNRMRWCVTFYCLG